MAIRIPPRFGRPMVHAGALVFLLATPFLTSSQILLFLLLVIAGNFTLPFTLPWVLPSERQGGGHMETLHYPIALLATFLAFALATSVSTGSISISFASIDFRTMKGWTDFFATGFNPISRPGLTWPGLAWITLAFGDPLLGFFQRNISIGPTLPWNPRKKMVPWLISLLILIPTLSSLGQGLLHLPWTITWIAVTLGLISESIWFGVDDNFVIPFTVTTTGSLWMAFHRALEMASGSNGLGWEWNSWKWALLIPFAFAGMAWVTRKLTLGGSLLGALFSCILWMAHPVLFLGLGLFFVIGIAATQFRMASKIQWQLAEPRRGQRGAAEVFGAMGIASWTAALPITLRWLHLAESQVETAYLLPIAAMLAKTMDTASSEIGKAFRGPTRIPPFFTLAAPGAEGGWSLLGTLAGTLAAGFLALLFVLTQMATWQQAFILMVIAFTANLVESLWARYWQLRDQEPGVHTNVILCLSAATLAWFYFFA